MNINKNITTVNRWVGTNKPTYICLHYTANGKSYKGMAKNNTVYFKDVYRAASAHYFVDDAEIWQCVEDGDSSWHCGDASSKNRCNNKNSIGIEICDNNGVFTASAQALAKELVQYLMKKYNIPIERVCRHYDVTGKACPMDWVKNPSRWEAFKKSLTEKEVIISMGEITSINGTRATDAIVLITDGRKSTGFNKYGTDVIIDKNGKITKCVYGQANTAIPSGCICLSGHGKNATYLKEHCKVGARLKIG